MLQTSSGLHRLAGNHTSSTRFVACKHQTQLSLPPQAPPPSLSDRDYRHFFGAAAILTSLGEYGGAHQDRKHGFPSKHKHLATAGPGFASKTWFICRFSGQHFGLLQELVWCSRTTPWQRGLMHELTQDLTVRLSLLTRRPHCNRKLSLQCLYLHLLLFPFPSASIRPA